MSPSGSNLPKEAEVSRTLEILRKEPINTQGPQDALLAPIYTLLMSAPTNEDGTLHWFCDKARPVVIEASIFLLRLHAYSNNPRVETWRMRLAGVLHACCGCVQSYMNAKECSRDTCVSIYQSQLPPSNLMQAISGLFRSLY